MKRFLHRTTQQVLGRESVGRRRHDGLRSALRGRLWRRTRIDGWTRARCRRCRLRRRFILGGPFLELPHPLPVRRLAGQVHQLHDRQEQEDENQHAHLHSPRKIVRRRLTTRVEQRRSSRRIGVYHADFRVRGSGCIGTTAARPRPGRTPQFACAALARQAARQVHSSSSLDPAGDRALASGAYKTLKC